MPVRRTRYGQWSNPAAFRKQSSRKSIFQPIWGLHVGEPVQDVPAGFTPAAKNFVTEGAWLTPRSGLSQFGNYSLGGPVLGSKEVYDILGNAVGVASSANTIAVMHPSVDSWSQLSYLPGVYSGTTLNDNLSATSNYRVKIVGVYDVAFDTNIAILSNGSQHLKWFVIGESTTTYSDFTWTRDLGDIRSARAMAVINDRLVLANLVTSTGTKYPTQVLWSVRGQPTSFNITDGAGAEFLAGAQDQITALAEDRGNMLLFTDKEIWLGQPRGDSYAFLFDRITDKLGCPFEDTVASTPLGVMFLGRDLEVYLVDSGGNILSVGDIEGGVSRIQQELLDNMIYGERAWAEYNRINRRYELYYVARDTSAGYPTRALYFDIDKRSWFPQEFNHELSHGFDYEDPGTLVTIDSVSEEINSVNQGIDSVGVSAGNRYITAFSSAGTAYRFRDDQTTDDGTVIDSRWRSHGLNHPDHMRKEHLHELWMDYRTNTASSVTVHLSSDLGASFDAGTAVSLPSSSNNAFVPLWVTAQSPQFEIRTSAGPGLKIGRFQASLRDAGQF